MVYSYLREAIQVGITPQGGYTTEKPPSLLRQGLFRWGPEEGLVFAVDAIHSRRKELSGDLVAVDAEGDLLEGAGAPFEESSYTCGHLIDSFFSGLFDDAEHNAHADRWKRNRGKAGIVSLLEAS